VRRLAGRLHSSPMALYHYVATKRDLFNLMLDATMLELAWREEPFASWREVLTHIAWESRRSVLRHPWTAQISAQDPEHGPNFLAWLERILAALASFGLDLRTTTRFLTGIVVVLKGFTANEALYQESAPLAQRRREGAYRPSLSSHALASGAYPHVRQYLEVGSELPDDAEFERALRWLLDGMERDLQGG